MNGKVQTEQFGAAITDKLQVEDRIRRAQHAILNPQSPAQRFLTEDLDENPKVLANQQSFSSDCISLQISGPDIADLSFCDLPGGSPPRNASL